MRDVMNWVQFQYCIVSGQGTKLFTTNQQQTYIHS